MNSKIITALAERVGRESIAIRSPYHVQFKTAPDTIHDLWFSGDGFLKWRLHGKRAVAIGYLQELFRDLDNYRSDKTDLSEMRGAIELAQSVREASRWIIGVSGGLGVSGPIRNAIFCDAGFKNGKGRISVVAILEDVIDAHYEFVESNSSNEAEIQAIRWAKIRYAEIDCPIFSDSAVAVRHFRDCSRVQWISRKKNGAADRLANMRGNNGS